MSAPGRWLSRVWARLRGPVSDATWMVYVDAVGGWRWRLLAGNGETVAQGESHGTRSEAVAAAGRVQRIVWEARGRLKGVEDRSRI